MICGYVHVADHPVTTGDALHLTRVPMMTTSYVVTFFSRRTFLSNRFTFSMAAEVVNCFTVMCIGWTPLVLGPAVAVIVISRFLTGKALEAVGERCGI